MPPNIGLTLGRDLAAFGYTTPPKMNRFWWNLEHSE